MRIIAGHRGGQVFQSPHGHRTHPMSEKVRGAIFSMLGDVSDLVVLDAFAGSGALGFEALSRGAAFVTAIDNDKNAQKAITENITKLNLESSIKLIRANASAWSDNNLEAWFDIVLLDPPYDQIRWPLIKKLAAHTQPQGTIVLSLPPATTPQLPSTTYQHLSTKEYGDAELHIYRKL